MFSTLQLNAELAHLHQQELRDKARKQSREDRSSGSPVLAAVGRQLVILGEKLQRAAHAQGQPSLELQTKQA